MLKHDLLVNVKGKDYVKESTTYAHLLSIRTDAFIVPHVFVDFFVVRYNISSLSLMDVYTHLRDKEYGTLLPEIWKSELFRGIKPHEFQPDDKCFVLSRWSNPVTSRTARLVGIYMAYHYQRTMDALIFISQHYAGVATPDNIDLLAGVLDFDFRPLQAGHSNDFPTFVAPVIALYTSIWATCGMNEVTMSYVPTSIRSKMLEDPLDMVPYIELLKHNDTVEKPSIRSGSWMSYAEFISFFRYSEIFGATFVEDIWEYPHSETERLTPSEMVKLHFNLCINDLRCTDIPVNCFLPDYDSYDEKRKCFTVINKHTAGKVPLLSFKNCEDLFCKKSCDQELLSIGSLPHILELATSEGHKMDPNYNIFEMGTVNLNKSELAQYKNYIDTTLLSYLKKRGLEISLPLERCFASESKKNYVKAYNYPPSEDSCRIDVNYYGVGTKGSLNPNLHAMVSFVTEYMQKKAFFLPEDTILPRPHNFVFSNNNASPGPLLSTFGKISKWVGAFSESTLVQLSKHLAHGLSQHCTFPHAKPQNTESERTRCVMAFPFSSLVQGKVIYQSARQQLIKNCELGFSAIGFTTFFGGPNRIVHAVFNRFHKAVSHFRDFYCKKEGVNFTDAEIGDRIFITSSSDLPKSDKKGKPMFAFLNCLHLYSGYNKEDLISFFGSTKLAFRAFLSAAMSYTDVYMVLRKKLLHFAGCTMSGGPNTVENNTTYHMHLAMCSAVLYYIQRTPGSLFSPELDAICAKLSKTLYTPFIHWDYEQVKADMEHFVDYVTENCFFCKFLSDDCIRFGVEGNSPPMSESAKDYFMFAGYEMTDKKYHENRGAYNIPDFCSSHPVEISENGNSYYIFASIRPEALLVNLLFPLEPDKLDNAYIRLARILAAIVCFTPTKYDHKQPAKIRELADMLIDYVKECYGDILLSHLKAGVANVVDSTFRDLTSVVNLLSDGLDDQALSSISSNDVLNRFYSPRSKIESKVSTCDICCSIANYRCLTCSPVGNDFAEYCAEHASYHCKKHGHVEFTYVGRPVRCQCRTSDITQLFCLTANVFVCSSCSSDTMKLVPVLRNFNVVYTPKQTEHLNAYDKFIDCHSRMFLHESTFLALHDLARYNVMFFVKVTSYYCGIKAFHAKKIVKYSVTVHGDQYTLTDVESKRPLKHSIDNSYSFVRDKKHIDVILTPVPGSPLRLSSSTPLYDTDVISCGKPYQALERCKSRLMTTTTLPRAVEDFITMTYRPMDTNIVPVSLRDCKSNVLNVVDSVFKRSFSVILGYPGTGKTWTAAIIIGKAFAAGLNVLYLTTTHSATEAAANAFLRCFPDFANAAFRNMPSEHSDRVNTNLTNIYRVNSDTKVALPRILFSTTMTGLPYKAPYHMVLIDEASLLSDDVWLSAVCTLPVLQHLVILGDPHQLAPIQLYDCTDVRAGNVVINHSLAMENSGHPCISKLLIGRRSNANITSFVSEYAYSGQLVSEAQPLARDVIFYSVDTGLTQTNYGSHCDSSLKKLYRWYKYYSATYPTCSIAVICTYSQAINHLSSLANAEGFPINIQTIDSSQGSGWDIVLYSLDGFGAFSNFKNRITVAISRPISILHVFVINGTESYGNFGELLASRGLLVAEPPKSTIESTQRVVGGFINPRLIARNVCQDKGIYDNYAKSTLEADCFSIDVEACRYLPQPTLPAIFQVGVSFNDGHTKDFEFRPYFFQTDGSITTVERKDLKPPPGDRFLHYYAILDRIYKGRGVSTETLLGSVVSCILNHTRMRPTIVLFNGELDMAFIVHIAKFGPDTVCDSGCKQLSAYVSNGNHWCARHVVESVELRLYNPIILDIANKYPRASLSALAERNDIQLTNAHVASADAQATLALFNLLDKKHTLNTRESDFIQRCWDKKLSQISSLYYRELVRHLCERHKDSIVLDIGCGSKVLSKLGDLPPNYRGIDILPFVKNHSQLDVISFNSYVSQNSAKGVVLLFVHSYLSEFVCHLKLFSDIYFVCQVEDHENCTTLPSGCISRSDAKFYYATPKVPFKLPVYEFGSHLAAKLAEYGIKTLEFHRGRSATEHLYCDVPFYEVDSPEAESSLEYLLLADMINIDEQDEKFKLDLPGYENRTVDYVGRTFQKGLTLAKMVHNQYKLFDRKILIIGSASRSKGSSLLSGMSSYMPKACKYFAVDPKYQYITNSNVTIHHGTYDACVFGIHVFDLIVSDVYIVGDEERDAYFSELASSLPFKLQSNQHLVVKITETMFSAYWIEVLSLMFQSSSVFRLPNTGVSSELWLFFSYFGVKPLSTDFNKQVYGAWFRIQHDEKYLHLSGSYEAGNGCVTKCPEIDVARLEDFDSLSVYSDRCKPKNYAMYLWLAKMKIDKFLRQTGIISRFHTKAYKPLDKFVMDAKTSYLQAFCFGVELEHIIFMQKYFAGHDNTKYDDHVIHTVEAFDMRACDYDPSQTELHLCSESHHDQYLKQHPDAVQNLREIVWDRLSRNFAKCHSIDMEAMVKYAPQKFSSSEYGAAIEENLPRFKLCLVAFCNQPTFYMRHNIASLAAVFFGPKPAANIESIVSDYFVVDSANEISLALDVIPKRSLFEIEKSFADKSLHSAAHRSFVELNINEFQSFYQQYCRDFKLHSSKIPPVQNFHESFYCLPFGVMLSNAARLTDKPLSTKILYSDTTIDYSNLSGYIITVKKPLTFNVTHGLSSYSFSLQPSTFQVATCDVFFSYHPPSPFDFVLIDPPWPNSSVHNTSPYSTFRVQDLYKLDLANLTSQDAVVACWVTNNDRIQRDAKDYMSKCGFEHVRKLTWIKLTKHGELLFDASHQKKSSETLLLFKREDFELSHSVFFSCTPPLHSTKPFLYNHFSSIIGRPVVNPVEYFARFTHPGWTAFGDQSLLYNSEHFYV